MTREEAILILGEFKEFCDSILWNSIYAERSRAIDMAIEALSADADRPQVEIKPFDAKEVFDEMLEHLPKDKPKEPHTQFLTLDDAVIVATRLFDIKGDDVEWVRFEFEQKTYLSNEQYCIGYETAKREIIDFINGADMRGE